MKRRIIWAIFWGIVSATTTWAQCPNCGNNTVDAGETNLTCPQDVPHAATCTSPCAQPGSFESTVGTRQTWDFTGTTTWSSTGLPVGWSFASGPSATTSGTLLAAGTDAYGAKAGLIQPNCSGSCTFTNGFCIGNLANSSSVFSGGSGGKLGANFDGRANVSQNLSYAVLRGQGFPTLVSPTFNMSTVNGFKVQFWLFPSETSCGQLNSWGSCVGNEAFLDFSSNSGSTWNQMIRINLSSSSSDMCFNNSTNTLWLNESSWSRVCLTVFRSTTSPGNFYTAASGTTAASGIMVNSAYFTSGFKFRIRYSQSASCTSGITTTNPGRYLAIDYPVVTSGNEMIPCGISFANMCGYGADNNDDGVGSSSTFATTVFGTTRRSPNQAERGVEIFTSQNASYAAQNLSGSSFSTNFDLCNAEGGDKQCIDWLSNNNFYTVAYECIADWEAPSGTGINVQYYKGTTPQSVGMTKVTTVGKTALIGWRYSAARFVACGSTSDLNPGCNGYSFLSGSLPTQFARGFYHLAINSTGQSWSFYGASSCSHYFNGPFFAPISVPDTLSGSGNYTICNGSNQLVFTGLSRFCSSGAGMSGSATLTITGPNGFSETINSGGQGTTPITDPGTYVIVADPPTSPTQCVDCSRRACIVVSSLDINNCNMPLAYDGLVFEGHADPEKGIALTWALERDERCQYFEIERRAVTEDYKATEFEKIGQQASIPNYGQYLFVDAQPTTGTWQYRLRLVDQEGTLGYSDIAEISLGNPHQVQMAPNPASGTVTITWGRQNSASTIELLDLAGRCIRKTTGTNGTATLSLAGIPRGMVLVRVIVEGEEKVMRLVVE